MLTNELTSLERQLIVARENFTAENPELKKIEDIYDAMNDRLKERREEIAKQFDQDLLDQMQQISQYKIQDIDAEMKSLDVHEKQIRQRLEEEDKETRELGQKQLAINDEKEKLNDIKELLERINRRITQLEMEGKRPATISVAYDASSIPAKTKQMQYTMVCIIGAFGAGVAVSFFAEKVDPRIRTPKDVLSQIGLPIIGTTSKLDNISTAELPAVVSEDYRTIYANLNLLNPNGIPKKLIITSSGMREGKTTFSINFATNMANSGKRVLLIDGDLRKPDVAKALKLSENAGLQSVLEGKNFADVVCRDCVPNLDVLVSAACVYDPSIACEVLNRLAAIRFLDTISDSYDHIIVDTPPVLAGPDAMMWAKMTDAVIMSSYSGQTVSPEMQEAVNRLNKIGVRVIGTVLHSVENDYSYYRYGYDYYTSGQRKKDKRRAENRPLLVNLENKRLD
jgi:capsular exopolysaccharide synthesis family protein